jgi:hypothetical protein
MSEHEELLTVLLDTDDAHEPQGAMWPELATAILAAGYRKPRTITTIEELDALPDMTVVMTIHGNGVTIYRDNPQLTKGSFHFLLRDEGDFCTVLFEPEPTK